MDKLLILIAVAPGLFLVWRVYKMDKIESEPAGLLVKLFFFGALSIIPALILELLWGAMFDEFAEEGGRIYALLENLIGVALMEELSKYIFLKWGSFKHKAFNYSFDGIVYAVCVGAGFAIFENITYAFQYGMGTTLLRAVTAIPGHIIFAIFMGYFYGKAKYYKNMDDKRNSKRYLRRALWIPVVLHGLYDFFAGDGSILAFFVFIIFVIGMDIIAYKKIKKFASEDEFIG